MRDNIYAFPAVGLNTSYVNVNPITIATMSQSALGLNTSYVNVNLDLIMDMQGHKGLNTSYVNVNHWKLANLQNAKFSKNIIITYLIPLYYQPQ